MSSILRINANRINGAKSRGPVTAEGKAIASQNALKHGLLARSVVLRNECNDGFEAAHAALRAELQPRTYVENELVEIMANANWRRKRAWHLEMAQLTHAIDARQSTGDPITDTALAFGDLCDHSTALRTLHRYEIRLSHEFIRHLLLLDDRRNISKRTQSQTNTDAPPPEAKP